MFEVIFFVPGQDWASSVSDSGLHIAKVMFNRLGKESSCILSIVCLKGDKGFEIFGVQVELMGKS